MIVLGVVLAVLGVAMLVAEAHVAAAGALGVAGVLALAAGLLLALSESGGGLALAIPVAAAAGAGGLGFLALVVPKAAATRRRRVTSGALAGRSGVVRSWEGDEGRVFVDGALWRARPAGLARDDEAGLNTGDRIVVEWQRGLTLRVRAAEEWEDDLR